MDDEQKQLRLPWTYRAGQHQVDDTVYRKQMQALWTIYGNAHHSDFVADVFLRAHDPESTIAFIIRACNNHYQLMKALEDCNFEMRMYDSKAFAKYIRQSEAAMLAAEED